jgi:hypothetical protein
MSEMLSRVVGTAALILVMIAAVGVIMFLGPAAVFCVILSFADRWGESASGMLLLLLATLAVTIPPMVQRKA